ncbi:Molybdenum cofactor guanylyltransferase [Methylocella tundrae]|uniref:Molybdenum cofactor guanylyltransferase n=1 Tax=Methylocella tundrae TaxID=227605 RepID=A0A8B6M934_METTU|nr:molybdenum cofactor guanylyltransferase MobA [Methylocella tundrae]VTZ51527.1 Molybdenum cofactor guanylyltransferase [Methylocella tundrae]
MTERCLGVLLAGGRAERMGGGDKPLRRVGGASILERVIAAMAPQCDGLVLNANGDPGRFAAYGLPIVADDAPGFKGPLAGILAGLDWIAANRPDVRLAVSAPTDTPFLPLDLVRRLKVARSDAKADLACARSEGTAHPVVALWPVAIREDLRHALIEEDVRKIDRFTQRYSLAYADWAAAPVDPFFNANEPADLAAAEAIAAAAEQENSPLPGK